MKTAEWIEKKIDTKPTKNIWCSSVVQDTDSNFFSYGQHYPLLVKYRNYWILNNKGYSVTTAKHISYCRDLADYEIPLLNNWPSDEAKQKEALKTSLLTALSLIQKQLQSKKRHNTAIFRELESQKNEYLRIFNQIIK